MGLRPECKNGGSRLEYEYDEVRLENISNLWSNLLHSDKRLCESEETTWELCSDAHFR